MSSTRYLEFDSTYRDRKLYPEPNNFIIEMSQSGQEQKLRARDPVSESSPVLFWNSSLVENVQSSTIFPITVSPINPGAAGTATFQITSGVALKQNRNYYVGAILSNETPGSIAAPYTVRRIVEYSPINSFNAMITVDSAIPDSLIGTNTFGIYNPTPIPTNTANSLVRIYIPGSNNCRTLTQRTETFGLGGDNYYINYYIKNNETGESRKIIAFDSFTRLATLENPTTVDWAVPSTPSAPNITYNFSIRKFLPTESGLPSVVPPFSILAATTSSVQISNSSPNPVLTGEYDGDFLRITPTPLELSPYTGASTEERQIRRYVYGTGTIPIGGIIVNLGTTASSGLEYIGCFLTDSAGTTVTILDYNPVTKIATLSGAVVAGIWFIRTCFLTSPFTAPPSNTNGFEIERFTRDNYNPFNYTGSLVSSEELVCYEVELINLILPNFLLESSRGGRAIFYPYLYVELQQITSGATINRNIIYSNNPNSFRMLFRAVVDDTPVPVISPFIKIDGNGMSHVIKFRPNDAFRVAVYHANGEPFKTIFTEQYSPTAPNPLCQISACFSFRRV